MKTIEERAKEIFDDAFDADEIIPVREGYIVEQQRRGYRIGATEQKKIDIEKAIDVIENLPQDFSRQMIIDALIEAME